MMKTECPHCHKVYNVYDMFRGVRAKCSECGREFTVEPMPEPVPEKQP
ncbi:zinc-ribbon domain-containing protein [Victivallis vadensis]|nr:zinc-ribbon domain-containing protein [Victivallis vadensis]